MPLEAGQDKGVLDAAVEEVVATLEVVDETTIDDELDAATDEEATVEEAMLMGTLDELLAPVTSLAPQMPPFETAAPRVDFK